MLRNVASQKWRVYAWDTTNGQAKTGDAANITAYTQKDDGTAAATNDTNPTEVSSSNQPGYYDFDMTQSETDGTKLSLSPKSSTSNVAVIACPPVVYTRPQYFSLLGIASDGDLNKVNTLDGHTAQTGDAYARIGATGSGLTSLAPASTALSTAQWTNTRAGYLDNLSGGAVALASGVTLSASGLQTDAVQEIRNAITGGAYALDTDSSGRVRIVDGTGAGELDTSSGKVSIVSGDITSIQSGLATASALGTVDSVVDAIKAVTDLLPDAGALTSLATAAALGTVDGVADAIKVVTDKLDDLIEDSTGYRFTEKALEEAPSGGGGGGDSAADIYTYFTSSSRELAFRADISDLPTNSELASALASADDAVLSAIAGLNNLSAGDIRTAIGLATANLDTQLDALPTANEVRNAVTGGAYALDTDSLGRVRIVDGTGGGELDTLSGRVLIQGTLSSLDALDTAQDAEHDSTQALLASINKLLRADQYIDQSTTPWQRVLIDEGTGDLDDGDRLLEQNLYDVDGADLTSTDTIVGQLVGA